MSNEKEITVEVTCSLNELQNRLREYGFVVAKEYEIRDIYMVDKGFKDVENRLELLNHCVLIRDITDPSNKRKLITYKYKEYNEKNEIVLDTKCNCCISSIDDAKRLLEAINYEELIKINDYLIVYSNEVDEFAVQLVNDKHIYMEIEDTCHSIEKIYQTIEEMKQVILKYNIPIKDNNYYVKKAEIELSESKK